MKVSIGTYPKKGGPRRAKVTIEAGDLYNMYNTFAIVIAPCLRQFREERAGYPSAITSEEWEAILDELVWTFDKLIEDDTGIISSEDEKRVQAGMELFGKWYRHLWQ